MRLPDGAVDVWYGRPRRPAAEDLAVLSADERNRVHVLHESVGADYAAAHAGVRRVVAGYLGVAPDRLRLGRALCPECADPAHGPPAVLWPRTDLVYNLSRSAGHWLLGIGRGSALGVDVEASPRVNPEQTAPMAFTPSELAQLMDRTGAARMELFLRCWTRKEAVVKAVGVGLAADLCRIEVRPEIAEPVQVEFGLGSGPRGWTVQGLDLGAGVTAALARAEGSTGPVRVLRYDQDPVPGGSPRPAGSEPTLIPKGSL